MAIREVVQSDLSGKDIPEGSAARLVVSDHPAISGSVELDLTTEEAGKFETKKFELVSLAIHEPGKGTRRVVMDGPTFAGMFKPGTDVGALLKSARKVSDGGTRTRRASAPKGERLDYSDPKHAGNLHRGKVTPAEAEYVRNNLDAVNERLKKEGGRWIDKNDPAEKKRYGF